MYENTRAAGFEVRRRVLIGTYVLSAPTEGPEGALADRALHYKKCDVYADRALGRLRDRREMDNPIAMYLNDVFTVTVKVSVRRADGRR